MANQTQNQQSSSDNQGSNQNPNRNRNRNRSRNRNRDESRDGERSEGRRSSGGGGNRSSRPGGNGGGKRFHKEKVPRREVKPSLWQRVLGIFSSGPPKSAEPAELPQTKANTQAIKRAEQREQGDGRGDSSERPRGRGRQRERNDDDRGGNNGRGPKVVTTIVKPKKPRPERQRRAPEDVEVTCERLYVGNLSYDAAEEDLENLFSGVGSVRMAEVVSHKHTQRSKGYAFIEMGSIDEAKRAVEVLHDQDFMGRKLVVSGAKSVGPRDLDAEGSDNDNEETKVESTEQKPAEQGEQAEQQPTS